MSGFLAHVSDTRDYLERLILHERDNMEERTESAGFKGPIKPLAGDGLS